MGHGPKRRGALPGEIGPGPLDARQMVGPPGYAGAVQRSNQLGTPQGPDIKPGNRPGNPGKL